jgi:uncharacterized protein
MFIDLVRKFYPDFGLPQDTKVLIETPDQVFAEYTAHTTAARTGRLIHHLFAARLVAKNGKIKLLRDSLNVVAGNSRIWGVFNGSYLTGNRQPTTLK